MTILRHSRYIVDLLWKPTRVYMSIGSPELVLHGLWALLYLWLMSTRIPQNSFPCRFDLDDFTYPSGRPTPRLRLRLVKPATRVGDRQADATSTLCELTADLLLGTLAQGPHLRRFSRRIVRALQALDRHFPTHPVPQDPCSEASSPGFEPLVPAPQGSRTIPAAVPRRPAPTLLLVPGPGHGVGVDRPPRGGNR